MTISLWHRKQMSFCALPDGRRLGYTQLGDMDGYPIFFFHGTPGSHLQGRFVDKSAVRHGFRFVAPDRPGMGFSDYQRDRKVTDWVKDVEALADDLGFGKFGVVGISGGGPYTLACGHLLRERVEFVILLSAWCNPLQSPHLYDELTLLFRAFAWSIKHCQPAKYAIAKMFEGAVRYLPNAFFDYVDSKVCESDRVLFRNRLFESIIKKDMDLTFRQGWRGPAHDSALAFSHPGYRLEEIDRRVHLFHGTADTVVPYSIAEYMAERLPRAQLHTIDHGGHFCAITIQNEIFDYITKLRNGG